MTYNAKFLSNFLPVEVKKIEKEYKFEAVWSRELEIK
jgi:hypothetical protein